VLAYPSSSVGATLKPAGLEISKGVIVGTVTMDPTDSQWDNHEGMTGFRAFGDKYMPGIDIADTNYLFGYTQAMLLEHLLKQCGNDLSRDRQAGQEPERRCAADDLAGHQDQHLGKGQHELYPDADAALDQHALRPFHRGDRRRFRLARNRDRREARGCHEGTDAEPAAAAVFAVEARGSLPFGHRDRPSSTVPRLLN
jgi:hypothetical protein